MIPQAIIRNAAFLGVFAMLTTALIAGTQLNTKDRIAEQVRIAREKALLEIVPRERHDNQMLDLASPVEDQDLLHLGAPKLSFLATQGGEPVAVILPAVAPDGYSGKIELLVGINSNGSIAGVRVIQHNETPGLGDKIDLKKSSWVTGFNGRSLGSPTAEGWAVKKDGGEFDQFTGATITPRAVVQAVYNALQYFSENRQQLLNPGTELASEANNE